MNYQKWKIPMAVMSMMVVMFIFPFAIVPCMSFAQMEGATITKEYDEVFATDQDLVPYYGTYANHTVCYSFKIKLVIETERDGTWIIGNEYNLYIYVRATFVDFDRFPDGIKMGNATVTGTSWKHEDTVPEAGSSIQADGFKLIQGIRTIHVSITWYPKTYRLEDYRVQPTMEGRITLYPRMEINQPIYYYNGFPITGWVADEPFYIPVRSHGFDFMPYLFMAIGFIGGLVTCALYYRKRRKEVNEARKSQQRMD